jgi:hypothetical protein
MYLVYLLPMYPRCSLRLGPEEFRAVRRDPTFDLGKLRIGRGQRTEVE